jgi:hypothetical protein
MAMQKHVRDRRVQMHACFAISNLVDANTLSLQCTPRAHRQKLLLDAQTHFAIFQAMDNHRFDEAVQEHACTALRDLFENNPILTAVFKNDSSMARRIQRVLEVHQDNIIIRNCLRGLFVV